MQNNVLFKFITSSVSKDIIRSYARRKLQNPGIQKRLNILEERETSKLEDVNVEELESDFMSVGNMHREHEREIKQYKDKEKYWIVRRKYFKEEKVNFLTWNDKEQIRYLHYSNPEEWTIEKLSEGFPASPETINKIVKGKWQKRSDSKIENHDKAVENNWRLLKDGKLSHLPETYLIHVKKFSSRKREICKTTEKITFKAPSLNNSPRSNEFSSIITSYEELTNKTNSPKKESQPEFETQESSEVLKLSKSKNVDNKHVTLNQLKENIGKNLRQGPVNKQDEMIFKELTNKENREIANENKESYSSINTVIKNRHTKNEVAVLEKQPVKLITYPEKIKIPKDVYKKGSTYKVNDCYYDDDGEFLYRVPGMY